MKSLIEALQTVLPQTQCRQCGFDGCQPYAEALAQGRARANRCPPGGQAGAQQLAQLLGQPVLAIDPDCGSAKTQATRVVIDEAVCIGCTKCIQACPVDAIIGARQHMHTVIADECTGCNLCIAPCPVDCIHIVEADNLGGDYQSHLDIQRPLAYQRSHARKARLARDQRENAERRAAHRARLAEASSVGSNQAAARQKTHSAGYDPVARALAAARAKRQPPKP